MIILPAKFQRLDADGTPVGSSLRVQFNPSEYTLNKGAMVQEIPIPGLDTPILQFVRGQAETMTLDLFFDSTENGMGIEADPVTELTDEFYQLVKIDPWTHAPPIVLFSWGGESFPGQRSYESIQGNQQRFGFKCVVESIRQRFTLFSPEGVPLRATLTVSLKEYKTLAEQITELNLLSADHTRARVIQQGDTLSRLAWQAYGDPGAWRLIADRNNVGDPLDLPPGLVLELPPNR